MISFYTDINIKRNGNILDKVDTYSFLNFKYLVSKIVYFDTFSDIAQKVGPVPMFLCILFSCIYHKDRLWKVKKNLNTFSCEKRHKLTFSLVFLLKIGKLHFSDYLRNKACPPYFKFYFCNLYE